MKWVFIRFSVLCTLLLCSICNLQAVAPKVGEVKSYAGRPTIHVDGKPIAAHMYGLTHAFGGRFSWEEAPRHNISNFYKAGFRLFYVDIWLSDLWPKDGGPLDISLAQRQVRGVLDVAPQAHVIMRVHVDAPYWWAEQNRDECVEYADGPTQEFFTPGPPHNNEDFSLFRSLRVSFASEKWRKEAGGKFAELCQRLGQTEEGNSLVGFHPSCGIYGEWHYWGIFSHDPDTGKAMTNYFRKWLRAKYGSDKKLQEAWGSTQYTLATATVPNSEERNRSQYGLFKDPRIERRMIDYTETQQTATVESIELFSRVVKQSFPRPTIVGAFYGYLHMTIKDQPTRSHLLVERILNCPDIDYIAAPQGYHKPARTHGGSGLAQGVVESAALHGKLWFDEMDNGEMARRVCHDHVRYLSRYDANYAPLLRRSTVSPLMRGGMWYYDFGLRESIGWFDDEVYLKSIRDEHELFSQQIHRPYESAADVLYVWSQEGSYYTLAHGRAISVEVTEHGPDQAMCSGAVGDHIYDFDIERANLDQYKAVVFMNSYAVREPMQKIIREKVAKNGRTVVFNYLIGVTDTEQIGLALCEKLSGLKLREDPQNEPQTLYSQSLGYEYAFKEVVTPAVTIADSQVESLATLKGTDRVVVGRKKMKDHTVVYATLPLTGKELFREIFRGAGCHLYNDHTDFTYVNSGLMLISTMDGGARTLNLKNGKTVNLTLEPRSTVVLDAESGKERLPIYKKELPNLN